MKHEEWQGIIWRQFGASIDMLESAIQTCPENLWDSADLYPRPWLLVNHTLFWLDLYLTGSVEDFTPPAPFGLEELDPKGKFPDEVYSKELLLDYLHKCREKCRKTIAELTEETAMRLCKFPWGEVSFSELLIYNLRHVQHGAAQLNLMLRNTIDNAGRWVGKTKTPLTDD